MERPSVTGLDTAVVDTFPSDHRVPKAELGLCEGATYSVSAVTEVHLCQSPTWKQIKQGPREDTRQNIPKNTSCKELAKEV
jgi:hypothetical protein